MGASAFLARQIIYGVYDPPMVPFTHGEILPEIPQSKEDIAFAKKDLADGLATKIYEQVTPQAAESAIQLGYIVSSAFVHWHEGADGPKGRFCINFHKQSKHWAKGTVRMETMPAFALDLQKGDHMLSFDIKAGYRHFRWLRRSGTCSCSTMRENTTAA